MTIPIQLSGVKSAVNFLLGIGAILKDTIAGFVVGSVEVNGLQLIMDLGCIPKIDLNENGIIRLLPN